MTRTSYSDADWLLHMVKTCCPSPASGRTRRGPREKVGGEPVEEVVSGRPAADFRRRFPDAAWSPSPYGEFIVIPMDAAHRTGHQQSAGKRLLSRRQRPAIRLSVTLNGPNATFTVKRSRKELIPSFWEPCLRRNPQAQYRHGRLRT